MIHLWTAWLSHPRLIFSIEIKKRYFSWLNYVLMTENSFCLCAFFSSRIVQPSKNVRRSYVTSTRMSEQRWWAGAQPHSRPARAAWRTLRLREGDSCHTTDGSLLGFVLGPLHWIDHLVVDQLIWFLTHPSVEHRWLGEKALNSARPRCWISRQPRWEIHIFL